MAQQAAKQLTHPVPRQGTPFLSWSLNWRTIVVVVAIIVVPAICVVSLARGIDLGVVSVVPAASSSMEPRSYDNDRLIAVPVRGRFVPGRMYLIRYNGELQNKEFAKVEADGMMQFRSANRADWCLDPVVRRSDVEGMVVAVVPWHIFGRDIESSSAKNYVPVPQEGRMKAELGIKTEARKLRAMGAHEIGVVMSDDLGVYAEASVTLPKTGDLLFTRDAEYRVNRVEQKSGQTSPFGGGDLALIHVDGFPQGSTGSAWWVPPDRRVEVAEFVKEF